MGSGEREDDYRFLQIVDAMVSINQRVNLFGVVVESSLPKQSKGTDCFCTLKIVDESRSCPGFTINVFATNMESLPLIESAGDIIQLSHVVMKTHGTEVYALFNKRFSSFALYEGKLGTNFVPYQVSSKFLARDEDKKFIEGLRKWSIDYMFDTGPDDSLFLKDIREGKGWDLVCKVLYICEVAKDEWMLFVWDGSDAPSVTLNTKLEDEMTNPLPLQLEHFPLSRDVLCEFPGVGTVLRVITDNSNEKLGLHLLRTGRWVKFINIKCDVHAGLWRGVLMPFSKLCYLADDANLVLKRKRFYDERIVSKWGRMPFLSFPWPSLVTETDYEDVSFVTLMDILSYPQVTAKFKCVVRVLAAFPWRAEDFRSPSGTYRIRLTLEDPTARVHAFLYAEDGENFFGGYHSIERMTKQRNMLLGVARSDADSEDVPRSPPWVQFCLKSYYVDKSDMWASRNYRIFGTRLMG